MNELAPPQGIDGDVLYEEDPFELGDIGEEDLSVVEDFLPPPEALVLKEPTTEKITIALSTDSLTFFREKAQELNAPYQRMIRNLLDAYVAQHRKQ